MSWGWGMRAKDRIVNRWKINRIYLGIYYFNYFQLYKIINEKGRRKIEFQKVISERWGKKFTFHFTFYKKMQSKKRFLGCPWGWHGCKCPAHIILITVPALTTYYSTTHTIMNRKIVLIKTGFRFEKMCNVFLSLCVFFSQKHKMYFYAKKPI